MNIDKNEAITFLKNNQPMPNDKELTEELITEYDEIRKYFRDNPDKECIPLFLNSFGEYNGYGVYQMVENLISKFTHDEVIQHIKKALNSKENGVRYWNANIAMDFPDKNLIEPLKKMLNDNNEDIRTASFSALALIDDSSIIPILKEHLNNEKDEDAKKFLKEVLEDLTNK